MFWPKSDTGRRGKGKFWPKTVTPKHTYSIQLLDFFSHNKYIIYLPIHIHYNINRYNY